MSDPDPPPTFEIDVIEGGARYGVMVRRHEEGMSQPIVKYFWPKSGGFPPHGTAIQQVSHECHVAEYADDIKVLSELKAYAHHVTASGRSAAPMDPTQEYPDKGYANWMSNYFRPTKFKHSPIRSFMGPYDVYRTRVLSSEGGKLVSRALAFRVRFMRDVVKASSALAPQYHSWVFPTIELLGQTVRIVQQTTTGVLDLFGQHFTVKEAYQGRKLRIEAALKAVTHVDSDYLTAFFNALKDAIDITKLELPSSAAQTDIAWRGFDSRTPEGADPDFDIIIKNLCGFAERSDPVYRLVAVECLTGDLSIVTRPIVRDRIQLLLSDADSEVCEAALSAVRQYGAHIVTPGIIETVQSLVLSKHEMTQHSALEAVSHLGNSAATDSLFKSLRKLLSDGNTALDNGIRRAFHTFREYAGSVANLDEMANLMNHPDERTRRQVGRTIREIGEHAGKNEFLERVVCLLRDERIDVRQEAAAIVGVIGRTDAIPGIVDELARLLSDEISGVACIAAVVLGEMGQKAAKPIVQHRLVAMLNSNDRERQFYAAMSLGKLGYTAISGRVG